MGCGGEDGGEHDPTVYFEGEAASTDEVSRKAVRVFGIAAGRSHTSARLVDAGFFSTRFFGSSAVM